MTDAIIDAHTHTWDLQVTPQPWIEPEAAPVLERNFSLQELKSLAQPVGVGSAIVVQSVNEAAETERLLLDAESDGFIAGVVGWADFSSADSEQSIERLLAGPGGKQLRGFRHVFNGDEAEHWFQSSRVNATIRALGRRNLTFDLLVRAHELPLALWVARRHPDVTLVLDHLAKPSVRLHALDPWRRDIAALSKASNVYAKISGLPAEADWTDWTSATLAPYFDAALDAFTPERLIFATDWPVCTVAGSYETVVDAQVELCRGLSQHELDKVLRGNARAAYGCAQREPG
jgi:L-fuconolactonase